MALEPLRMVIAPDVIFDLVWNRGGSVPAAMLFDAIAADVEAGVETRRAYVSPVTLPLVHQGIVAENPGPDGRGAIQDLLKLLELAHLTKADYVEATSLHEFDYVDALQFVTCRAVGAQFLVTRRDYGVKRSPVLRRTAGEVVPLFRR